MRHTQETHIDGGSDERADITPIRIFIDQTDEETLCRASLSTCVCEDSECLFGVSEGIIIQLRSSINLKENYEFE